MLDEADDLDVKSEDRGCTLKVVNPTTFVPSISSKTSPIWIWPHSAAAVSGWILDTTKGEEPPPTMEKPNPFVPLTRTTVFSMTGTEKPKSVRVLVCTQVVNAR